MNIHDKVVLTVFFVALAALMAWKIMSLSGAQSVSNVKAEHLDMHAPAFIHVTQKRLMIINPCTAGESLFIDLDPRAPSPAKINLVPCGTYIGAGFPDEVAVSAPTPGHGFVFSETEKGPHDR